MCGIVGAVAQQNIVNVLVNGLQRLEYRGYDSSGVALITQNGALERVRCVGKVNELAQSLERSGLDGCIGIAHTRWATHGKPTQENAHPHFSNDHIAVVHNGIIENYETLRTLQQQRGYKFTSQTDTEVIAHLVDWELKSSPSLLEAVQKTVAQLEGAYGTVVMDKNSPDELVVARSGSPLVIGLTDHGHYIASDQLALLNVTRQFIFLEEGDVARVTINSVTIYDQQGRLVERPCHESNLEQDAGDKGLYAHYMLKEIFDQPTAIRATLADRIKEDQLLLDSFEPFALECLQKAEHIQIVACGTSYNSGMAARYWFEGIAGVSCDVEIASEFRYRDFVVRPNSLLITLSQSGETADTLAALRIAKERGYMAAMTICNVAGSSMVREADFAIMTKAGIEIGVASTKAFTTQLVNMLLLVVAIAKLKKRMPSTQEYEILHALQQLPAQIEQLLNIDVKITELAKIFAHKKDTMFIGRGIYYPIAMEAALKLKEISYIHAEAYAAGELKHGPLALIDEEMPTIVIAPYNDLFDKLKSNIEEIHARGGELFIFADVHNQLTESELIHPIYLATIPEIVAPIYYTIPMQLFAYHVALVKGTDVDKPRNLAKAVTVE